MKFIYASSVDLGLPRGPSVNEREFCAALAARFAGEVTIIGPEPSRARDELAEELKGAVIESVGLLEKRRVLSWIKHQVRLFLRCRAVLRRYSKDDRPLFIIRLDFMPVAIAAFVFLYSPGFVLKTAGDGAFRFLGRHRFIVRLMAIPNRILYKIIMRCALFIDVVTRRHADDLAENLGIDPRRIGVVDNGVNPDRFVPESRNDARSRLGLERFGLLVGYVGNEPWCRGGQELIDVASVMRAKRPDVGILIVGGGPQLGELEEQVVEKGLTDCVVLTGQVDYSEICTYINALDLGVSFLEMNHRGASEQKVRQYLSCGRPAVVTPGGSGFVEAADVGAVVEVDDIEALGDVLIKWAEKSPDYKDKCRAYAVETLSIDARLNERLGHWGI